MRKYHVSPVPTYQQPGLEEMKINPLKTNSNPRDIAVRILLFSTIWLILSGGDLSSWWIGIPATLFAVIVSIALIPPVSLVWFEVPAFIGFFLIRSLAGGTDVAWRALHPRMPIAPDLVVYPLRIPPGLPQVFMTNTVNLLPGTLIAELNPGFLKVHVLDKHQNAMIELQSVEQRVARLFGIRLQFDNKKP